MFKVQIQWVPALWLTKFLGWWRCCLWLSNWEYVFRPRQQIHGWIGTEKLVLQDSCLLASLFWRQDKGFNGPITFKSFIFNLSSLSPWFWIRMKICLVDACVFICRKVGSQTPRHWEWEAPSPHEDFAVSTRLLGKFLMPAQQTEDEDDTALEVPSGPLADVKAAFNRAGFFWICWCSSCFPDICPTCKTLPVHAAPL